MEIVVIGIFAYLIYIVYSFNTAEKCVVCFGEGAYNGYTCRACGGSGRKV